MNEELRESIIELLIQKATFGLSQEDLRELERLENEAGIREDDSFDIAAAAIGLVDLEIDEQLPDHLQARIAASAEEFFANVPQSEHAPSAAVTNVLPREEEFQKMFMVEPRRSWNWLGWAVAAAACVALAVNVWFTRMSPPEIVSNFPTPAASPVKLSPEEEYALLVASQPNMTKASWATGNMKDLKEIGGDVVWSDEIQKGFMRLRGLPVNDKSKETYQLWIFDKTQDKATPIDGGTFDVEKGGEVIIPINAKLKAQGPELFAITVEKPGGVVVSKRGKIAALATVETKTRSNV